MSECVGNDMQQFYLLNISLDVLPSCFNLHTNNTTLDISDCVRRIRQSPILYAGDTPIPAIKLFIKQMRSNTTDKRM